METIWKDICISLLMGLVVPGLMLNFAGALIAEEPETIAVARREETIPEESAEPDPVSLPVRLRQTDGTVADMDMDAYLVGVVLAEMPASFEPEALKAQAVVARTYARKAYVTGGKHGDGSICANPSCCQAYRTEDAYRKEGGSEESVDKVRRAVMDTSGLVLTYEGSLIEATYFSCSGGTTEDAAAVWGTDFPYLRSVSSPGEEDAAYYSETCTFSPEVFAEKLGIDLPEDPADWFHSVTYTPGGGIDTMSIGGKVFRGTELRCLLGLRSTAISLSADASCVTVITRGFGHRVGMSQYGADAMALSGSLFPEILAHYYPGTQLTALQPELPL